MSATKDHLLVQGFIRIYSQEFSINIPPEIHQLFFLWFHITAQILTWNAEYRSMNTIQLSEDKVLAKRNPVSFQPSYILADIEPVFDGIHCWRIQV